MEWLQKSQRSHRTGLKMTSTHHSDTVDDLSPCHSQCLPHQLQTLVLSLLLLLTLESGCSYCHSHLCSSSPSRTLCDPTSLCRCFKFKAWERGIWLARSKSCVCIFAIRAWQWHFLMSSKSTVENEYSISKSGSEDGQPIN